MLPVPLEKVATKVVLLPELMGFLVARNEVMTGAGITDTVALAETVASATLVATMW